jgi:TonB family protein
MTRHSSTTVRPVRVKLFHVLLACLAMSPVVTGAEPMSCREAIARRLIVKHPTPQLPVQSMLRKQRFHGHGVFDLEFDFESGSVRAVRVVQGTGSSLVDRSTVVTLKEWRAKPRTVHVARLPITFNR